MLDKPGGLRTTWIELLSWISSPQPLKITGGKIRGLRDCVAKKGLTSLCWVCVGVLESRLFLVLVFVAL